MKHYLYRVHYYRCEKLLWRLISVPWRMKLDRFAYVILSSFDTSGTLDFTFRYRKRDFEPMPNTQRWGEEDMTKVTLSSLRMVKNEKMDLFYDIRWDHWLVVTFLGTDEERSDGVPIVLDGAGRGILENWGPVRFTRLITTEKEPYSTYRPFGRGEFDLWDFNDYSIEEDNERMAYRTEMMEHFYRRIRNCEPLED
jgi:hypothetical protein